jgi:hypothetical protein
MKTTIKKQNSVSIKNTTTQKIYTVLWMNSYKEIKAKNMTDAIRKLLKDGAYDLFQRIEFEVREGKWEFASSKRKGTIDKLKFSKKQN